MINKDMIKAGRSVSEKILCSLLVFVSLSLGRVYANDELSAIMEKMKTEQAVKIAYQETRTLELFDQPWHGSGFMYSLPPGLMIREQIKPEHLLMGINGEQLFYFDPNNHIRHQSEMDAENPLALNIVVFKALINADEALLRQYYVIEFSDQPQRWMMTLSAKQDPESGFNIIVSGRLDQQADTIIVRQADGDVSEFMLQNPQSGDDVTKRVWALNKELTGAESVELEK